MYQMNMYVCMYVQCFKGDQYPKSSQNFAPFDPRKI